MNFLIFCEQKKIFCQLKDANCEKMNVDESKKSSIYFLQQLDPEKLTFKVL